jgi:hypothetical protein
MSTRALFVVVVAGLGCTPSPVAPTFGTAREGDACAPSAAGESAAVTLCGEGLHCQRKDVPPKKPGGPADAFEVDGGAACGGIAGYHCREGFVCEEPPNSPADGMGTCVAPSICARGSTSKEDIAFRAGPGGDSGVGWKEITIESIAGPCAADGRSCFKKRHAFPSGWVIDEALANPTPEEKAAHPDAPKFTETRRQLDPADLRALDTLLRSRDFQRGMRGHFACARQAFDANITFSISFADGTASEDVTMCIIDPSLKPNLPAQVAALLTPR